MDEEKPKEEQPAEDTGDGDQPPAATIIDKAHAENERMVKLLADLKEENDRREEIIAKQMLGGTAEAGIQPPKKVPLTDTEYAEAFERGEVNPLKDDGYI